MILLFFFCKKTSILIFFSYFCIMNTDVDFFAFLDNLENEGKGGHYRYNEAEHQVWVEQDVDPDISK